MLFGEALDLVGVAADNDGIDHETVAIAEHHAALVSDGQDRAHQVLVIAHAPCDAVHDESEPSIRHKSLPNRLARVTD
ncbi:hypothetical protein D3C72_2122440 [compost metagenome]